MGVGRKKASVVGRTRRRRRLVAGRFLTMLLEKDGRRQ